MESEHRNDKDKRVHYTAYELNMHGQVLRTTHFIDKNEDGVHTILPAAVVFEEEPSLNLNLHNEEEMIGDHK